MLQLRETKDDLLTHCGGENDNPQDVHLVAFPWNHLVVDLGSRGQLKEHRVAHLGVFIIWHNVDIVGLGFEWDALDVRYEIRFILKHTMRGWEISIGAINVANQSCKLISIIANC